MEPNDAARGRALVERWCALAEQRLEHLGELFDSGRWRRYFGEQAFMDNIQDAKAAAETWRSLLQSQTSFDAAPADLSWLGRRPIATAPRRSLGDDAAPSLYPLAAVESDRAAPAPVDPPRRQLLTLVPPEPLSELSTATAPEEPVAWQRALDPELLAERYPLLRQAS